MKVVDAVPILQETTVRGRWIAELDLASCRATDAVYAKGPNRSLMGLYVPRREVNLYKVAFGRLLPHETAFCVAYEAASSTGPGGDYEVSVYDPPYEDKGGLLGAARAISLSGKVFPFHPRAPAYNCVVIPEDEGRFSVYWYPGTKDPATEVMGADGVAEVSSDGHTQVTCYHKNLLVQPRSAPDSWESHTHLLILEPVPMDVAYVLMRRPPSPSMIMSEAGMYFIDQDGKIFAVPVPPTGSPSIDRHSQQRSPLRVRGEGQFAVGRDAEGVAIDVSSDTLLSRKPVKQPLARARVLLPILTALSFVLAQIALVQSGWAGGQCVRSLTEPSGDDHPMFSWREYGVPARFLTVSTEGCFEGRATATEWDPAGLIIDVVAFGGIGGAAYLSTFRRRRIQPRQDFLKDEDSGE